jgi:hypothetical protein
VRFGSAAYAAELAGGNAPAVVRYFREPLTSVGRGEQALSASIER